MTASNSRDRLVLLAVGVLVLLAPAVILLLTLGVLALLGELALGDLTPVEFLELYVVDLVVLAGLAYGIYRLTRWAVTRQTTSSDEPGETATQEETANDTSPSLTRDR